MAILTRLVSVILVIAAPSALAAAPLDQVTVETPLVERPRDPLSELTVFHSGVADRAARHAVSQRVQTADVGGGIHDLLSGPPPPSRFYLTPARPVVQGHGLLQLSRGGWCPATTAQGYCRDGPPAVTFGAKGPNSDESLNLVVDGVAGQTYLIDESVVGAPSGSGCRFATQGPDGTIAYKPCAPNGQAQHLLFVYKPTHVGEGWFATWIEGPAGATTGIFYGAEVAPMR
jgi:hypothetical protein